MRRVVPNLRKLWRNHRLIFIWLKYNIQTRYSQSILGIAWILLVPLATSLILALVFSKFFNVQLDVPFIVFFFGPYIVFNIFSQAVAKSTTTILGAMGLIGQVNFPREILILVTLGEVLVDFVFTFIAMLFINGVLGFWPNQLYIFLPVLLLIMTAFTLGIMLLVSFLSVVIRDIPQLVGIALQLLFYLTPVIYPVQNIPLRYRFIAWLNPLAPIVQASRDIIVYARMPDMGSLIYPTISSAVMLFIAYILFKANEGYLADMV